MGMGGKNGGKGKDFGFDKGYDKGWDATPPWEKGKGAKGAKGGYAAHGNGADADVIIAAAQRLPPELAHPQAQGPVVALGIPATMASGLIGKSGAGTKEIAASTGAKVNVRPIEGD